ncbi:MAG: hypothetical protein LBH74_05665 [Nitrososphaerota archaeon]|jgi:hypothetical protein|nr:hypothetical protein [Candidatus Termitimicrobium sp.]MCL2432257.1 hypothetical protein [Candidatus Termitimicrobium sp.]MDR0493106.1 hypothetical protein [Nitrososphaerota archaeon]
MSQLWHNQNLEFKRQIVNSNKIALKQAIYGTKLSFSQKSDVNQGYT